MMIASARGAAQLDELVPSTTLELRDDQLERLTGAG
jgi:hypothetical protein